MEQDKTAILKKLFAIMGDVEFVNKDKTNTNANYNYASEKAIKQAVYGAIRKHGVVFTFSALEIGHIDFHNVGKNGETFSPITTAKFAYGFHDIDTGQSIEGTFIGTGNGREEKGYYAAVTGAIKYCLTSNLGLVTGEESDKTPTTGNDPEDDKFEAPPPSTATRIASRVQGEVVGRTESPRPPSGPMATEKQVSALLRTIELQRGWGGLDKLSEADYHLCEKFAMDDEWRTAANAKRIFTLFPYKKKDE